MLNSRMCFENKSELQVFKQMLYTAHLFWTVVIQSLPTHDCRCQKYRCG